jgi:hypothetical protein
MAPQPDTGRGTEGGAADAGLADAGDPTAPLFDPSHIVEVRIDMVPGDWDQLRQQTRSIFDLLAGDCLAAPFPSPFTYFVGTVSVDGQTLTGVGIRKKGFIGSLSTEKPSLKLKFDHTTTSQRAFGTDDMTLNNAKQDPALVRQCLGYAAFARAGLPGPRCNFAHVVVNGADLGVFVHVEAVDKDLLAHDRGLRTLVAGLPQEGDRAPQFRARSRRPGCLGHPGSRQRWSEPSRGGWRSGVAATRRHTRSSAPRGSIYYPATTRPPKGPPAGLPTANRWKAISRT